LRVRRRPFVDGLLQSAQPLACGSSMTTRNDLDAWMWLQACELLGRAERPQPQFFRPLEAGPRGPA
jgi:hypothetical protein